MEEYEQRVGEPKDFEAVAFHSDFIRLLNIWLLTPSIQQYVLDFFQISLKLDLVIDWLCVEAFIPITTAKKAKSPRKTPSPPAAPRKRAKNYNSPFTHSLW